MLLIMQEYRTITGQALRAVLMRTSSISQKVLADEIGVMQPLVSRALAGDRTLSPEQLSKALAYIANKSGQQDSIALFTRTLLELWYKSDFKSDNLAERYDDSLRELVFSLCKGSTYVLISYEQPAELSDADGDSSMNEMVIDAAHKGVKFRYVFPSAEVLKKADNSIAGTYLPKLLQFSASIQNSFQYWKEHAARVAKHRYGSVESGMCPDSFDVTIAGSAYDLIYFAPSAKYILIVSPGDNHEEVCELWIDYRCKTQNGFVHRKLEKLDDASANAYCHWWGTLITRKKEQKNHVK